MRIGITYDLKEAWLSSGYSLEETAEFDSLETVQAIENALRSMGHQPVRIGGLDDLMTALCRGRSWDMVFNIAEGMHGFGRESAIPAILDARQIPYTFSDPLVLAVSLHKATAKRVVRDCGLKTPRFIVVETPLDLENAGLNYPVFAKPIAEGTGKGVDGQSFIKTPEELEATCRVLLAKHRQPVLVEEFLPGREFTVGIVGTGRNARVVGVMEVLVDSAYEGGNYGYENKAKYEDRVSYVLASGDEAEASAQLALDSWLALGCRDGGRVDVRMDSSDRPAFIEVNPLPGLHPVDSDLPILCGLIGVSYDSLIEQIVNSALDRVLDDPEVALLLEELSAFESENVA
ncbi:D-alanine--D-alanine ligase family protein [Desulfovibrio ferrophilus]|uniref:D-alanine--D-alanine ligase n=1 Tax=Desulfovibrio ferrophilus TaxID=241368 RepID=A0A2Z6AXX2_9BACT|nr:ATP-grasp domain-containing protein [Desulfovibrio ferrophilus]BBD08089.1 D-alanine--D-alanine ligase [Desulfovibrio ferrophilus]